jgi:hypothetical protein
MWTARPTEVRRYAVKSTDDRDRDSVHIPENQDPVRIWSVFRPRDDAKHCETARDDKSFKPLVCPRV